MDARERIEEISLDLLVSGRVEPATLVPRLQAVRTALGDEQALAAIDGLLAEVERTTGPGGAPEGLYDRTVATLETLRRSLETGPGQQALGGPGPQAAAPAPGAPDPPVAIEPPQAGQLTYQVHCDRDILAAFFAEADEHLRAAEEALLVLEAHPQDAGPVDALFRAIHSLKGICGYIGLKAARELAHHAESVLGRARTAARALDGGECDAVLAAVDVLGQIVTLLRTHSETPHGPLPWLPEGHPGALARIQAIATGPPPEAPPPPAALGARQAIPARPIEVSPPLAPSMDTAPASPWESGDRSSESGGSDSADWTSGLQSPASRLPRASPDHRAVPAEGRGAPAAGAPPPGGVAMPGATAEPARRTSEVSLVRVSVEKLDRLVDAIGELVLTQSQITQDAEPMPLGDSPLADHIAQLARISRDLHALAMSLRMFPLRDTFMRMTRVGRDLAHKQGKDIEIVVSGEETELDKKITESLVDPLTHLINNAVDHGIEPAQERVGRGKPARARLYLSARCRAGEVIVEVRDDGRGLDLERIRTKAIERGLIGPDATVADDDLWNLIFAPGFSTASTLTEVSGRGVGLDVVRSNIEGVGGGIFVTSAPGQGTTFRLALPLTLAILEGMTVRAGSRRYIVPSAHIVEIVHPSPEQIRILPGNGEWLWVREAGLPLVRLRHLAGPDDDGGGAGRMVVIVVEAHGNRYGLVIDEVLGHHQVLIKSLAGLRRIRGLAGAAVMGDGRVCLVLDLSTLPAAIAAASGDGPPASPAKKGTPLHA